jgi:hypothetical protein
MGGCTMIPRWNYGQYVARLCALAFFWRAESRRANHEIVLEVCLIFRSKRTGPAIQTKFFQDRCSRHWTLVWWDRQLPVFLSGVGYIDGDWVLLCCCCEYILDLVFPTTTFSSLTSSFFYLHTHIFLSLLPHHPHTHPQPCLPTRCPSPTRTSWRSLSLRPTPRSPTS